MLSNERSTAFPAYVVRAVAGCAATWSASWACRPADRKVCGAKPTGDYNENKLQKTTGLSAVTSGPIEVAHGMARGTGPSTPEVPVDGVQKFMFAVDQRPISPYGN